MARDPDLKNVVIGHVETRGARSKSQKSRDLSDRFKGLGDLLSSSPKLMETLLSLGLATGIVYLLRPKLAITKARPLTPFEVEHNVKTGAVVFRGERTLLVQVTYPDRVFMEYFAIACAVIAAPGGGEVGSIIAPIGFGLTFKKFIEVMFPDAPADSEVWQPHDLVAGHIIRGPVPPDIDKIVLAETKDVTLTVYTKIVLPRYLKALMVAAFFVFLLRFVRNIGGS